ncbi:hypothetical protein [Piscinibacter defluvii]|uniref:hypothetical protein n=1 Tax=Piscinibacter defluvii TaxID=1796922 RepID=UPI000FDE884E|nr:hypothetical protein [Piscinibacter defluvii]
MRSTNHRSIRNARRPLRALLAVAVAGILPHAGALAAGEWKGYAGVNCLPGNSNDSVRRSATSDAALANAGTSTISVFCPVVRDVEASGSPRVLAAVVRMRNRHATASASCEFSVHNQAGNKVGTVTRVAPFGEHDLNFPAMNAPAWGSYVIRCSLPGRDPATNLQSYIINYRVDEAP